MNADIVKYRLLLLLLLLSFFSSFSYSQSNHKIRFSSINTDDGLPNNTINAIANDNLGFLWIGTNDGLCRYEASGHVKVYHSGFPSIEGGLESSNIRALYLDSKNNLWIGTRQGGLTKYHPPSDSWTTYRHDKNDPKSISNDEILTITEDRQGRLWVGTEDGLNVYHYDTQSFTSFKANNKSPHALQAKAVLSILCDDRGWIWVGTWAGGLHLLVLPEGEDIARAKFRNFTPNESNEALNIWKLYQDKQKRYWVGARGAGLFLMQLPANAADQSLTANWQPFFHNYTADKSHHGITSNHIHDIFEDSRGDFWIAAVNGLNRILAKDFFIQKDPSSKPAFHFHKYFFDSSNQTAIANNDISTVFEDTQGIIWFGTYSGVSHYNWHTNQFDVHELFDDIAKMPNAQNLYIDLEGIAWLGNGENGLLNYDFKQEKITPFTADQGALDGYYISSLYSPDNKHLYIGANKGVFVLNLETHKIKSYPLPVELKTQVNSLFIRSILKDKQGRIWLGSEQGLFVIFEKDGSYVSILHDPADPNAISDNTINQVFEDSQNNIWVATYNGLNKMIKIQDGKFQFKQFKHDPDKPETSIPNNRQIALEEIDGTLYIGSSTGLSGYDLKEKTFTNFSKEKNKYSIQSIEKTNSGNLWVSTTEGIIFFDTQEQAFNKYEKRDGLGDLIYHTGASYQDRKGFFYFGSRRGITRFQPETLQGNEVPPPVHITDIRIMSPEKTTYNNTTYAEEIILTHDQYYLSLDYVALNYNRSEKNQYAFMLEGFEDKWNYIEKKTPAVYTNLKPGEYTFRVKAANNDGVWNDTGTALRIIKKPALWETWWFRVIAVTLCLFIIWLGIKAYTKNITQRNRIQQLYINKLNTEINRRKLVEKELQEREQHLKDSNEDLQRSNRDLEQFAYIASHDLQEPLRVVGNFVGLLRRRYKQHFDEEAFQYIDFAVDGVRRMSAQIQSILTFAKVGKKEIVFEKINLLDSINTKIHDLSEKIKQKNVIIEVGKMPDIYCEKNQIEMIFHNLLSNAIKFNNKDNPAIIITHDDIPSEDFWQFSVKDNGIGIQLKYQHKIFEIFRRLHNKQDYEGTGIGLALCQKIVHRHQGKIWLDSKENEGTTFYFTISKKLGPTKQVLEEQKRRKQQQEWYN